MEDIVRITKSLEDFSLLIKCVSERIQNEAKEQKGVFFGMLTGTILGNCFKLRSFNIKT